MTTTIDELCEQLGVTRAISEDQFKGRHVPYDLQAKWYDRHSLPSTKVVAPIVSERLQGVETVVELGSGTGFRVLYYALNNLETQFLAIDKDRNATDQLKERVKKLKIRNVRVQTRDMYELHGQYAAVMAIDCFFYPSESNAMTQWRTSCLHLSRLVDRTKSPAFFVVPFYDALGSRYEMSEAYVLRVFQKAQLRLDATSSSFEFNQCNGEHWIGRILCGRP